MSLTDRPPAYPDLRALGVLLLVVVALGAAFAWFFARLPVDGTTLAMDWKGLWACLRSGIHYDGIALRNPPWSIFYLYPLAQLPMQAAWGVAMYLTLIVLVLSVPPVRPRWRTWLGILLLTTSYPSLRHMADGNFEGILIAGLLLILYGYNHAHVPSLAAGLLLSSVKPQALLLLLPVLGVYMLITLPRRVLLQTGAICLLFVVPGLLWRGEEWWTSGITAPSFRNFIIDMSLNATWNRMGFGMVGVKLASIGTILGFALIVGWRTRPYLTRELAGMLLAASLLIAPYSASNSVLAVLAIGIIPLFQHYVILGLVLIGLHSVGFWLNTVQYGHLYAYYHTALTLISMLALAAEVWRKEKRRGGAGKRLRVNQETAAA